MPPETALGAIESPQDYRDQIASAAMGVEPFYLPATHDTGLGPVQMQAKIPACVSHSVVDILKLYWFIRTGEWVDFSPRFLDILAKRIDGQPIDGGTFPRLVMSLVVKYGCCTTKTLPNDTSLPLAEYRRDSVLTPEMFEEAKQYKIPGYVRVPTDYNSVRQNIFLYGAVTMLFSIGEELWIPSWDAKDTDPLRTPKKIVSGHQMTPKGWTGPKYNTLRNEWSDRWAKKGETEYDPVEWAPFIREAWAIAQIPKDVKDFLSSLPAKADFHHTWNTDMKLRDRTDDVKFLQVAYMILGHLTILNPEEFGIFGPKTAAANSAYQASKGIFPQAPNNAGPRTRSALNLEFSV